MASPHTTVLGLVACKEAEETCDHGSKAPIAGEDLPRDPGLKTQWAREFLCFFARAPFQNPKSTCHLQAVNHRPDNHAYCTLDKRLVPFLPGVFAVYWQLSPIMGISSSVSIIGYIPLCQRHFREISTWNTGRNIVKTSSTSIETRAPRSSKCWIRVDHELHAPSHGFTHPFGSLGTQRTVFASHSACRQGRAE